MSRHLVSLATLLGLRHVILRYLIRFHKEGVEMGGDRLTDGRTGVYGNIYKSKLILRYHPKRPIARKEHYLRA